MRAWFLVVSLAAVACGGGEKSTGVSALPAPAAAGLYSVRMVVPSRYDSGIDRCVYVDGLPGCRTDTMAVVVVAGTVRIETPVLRDRAYGEDQWLATVVPALTATMYGGSPDAARQCSAMPWSCWSGLVHGDVTDRSTWQPTAAVTRGDAGGGFGWQFSGLVPGWKPTAAPLLFSSQKAVAGVFYDSSGGGVNEVKRIGN